MSSLQRKRQAKKQARIAMKRIRAAEDLAGNESMPIGSGVAVVDWRTPPSAAVAVAEAAADRPRYFKDETGEVHAFTKDDAKHDASGWINVSLVTEDGDYESHPYDLFETGPHDMQLVGGVGLRMYFDYVHRTALIFFGVGVLSLISCHAMKEGGQLGHGMYFLPATSRFRTIVSCASMRMSFEPELLYCFPVSSAGSPIILFSCVQRWTQENNIITSRFRTIVSF
eukprot:SAG31_NODE_874_length_11319_cov_3.145098_2_plen_226_part_00